jgi:hypothetical protein
MLVFKVLPNLAASSTLTRLDIRSVYCCNSPSLLGRAGTCVLLCNGSDSRHTAERPVCLSGTPEPNISVSDVVLKYIMNTIRHLTSLHYIKQDLVFYSYSVAGLPAVAL